ncbi:efflux RND transporter permease subunit [Cohnella lubricantis]|uniref:Efflux RND transporter permease subunit n=1 Tax=Cohnella lubricantis TaxID=2163172 RepID=A0A841TAZ2_9BACL|nr:efflux RND transporter permease subunit [Cohnella lubricantis]MBB6678643.1 efflux RND transporter permease subunit [Cohnella lubricantis]MBP2119197.1 HAE1 family hydrophobic/amphiphilic exporter-1 [Cohnella lubricantis]
MRSIINFSLNNKFALWMITIIVLVAGLYSGMNMKQESLPNLSLPYLSVTTVYPGASPDAVVEQVTAPLEQRFKNVESVKNVTSTSMENASSIMVEFDFGQDMDKAVTSLREAAGAVSLPSGAQEPSIAKFSIGSFPVISVSVSGGDDLESLTDIVNNEFKPQLEGISGVASVAVSGQFVKEVQLKFHDDKLQQLGMSQETVKQLIQAAAMKAPLGIYELDNSEKSLVVDGRVTTIEALKELPIPAVPMGGAGASGQGMGAGAAGAGAAGGADIVDSAMIPAELPTVKLSELADIELVGQAESISRTNGKESIGIQVVKANDANTVDVVNAVKDANEELAAKYPNISIDVLLDQGKPIEDSVHTMLNKALFGALFAVIIILLFLRNIRTTIISIVSIPLSLLIGILLLQQFDITLNIMTLGAMTVAIGRVVDDSIVVIENIYRRMSLAGEKLKGKDLVREATREMFLPIMSSTIVTIAVFLPLGTVSGMVGQLFLPFALTIVFALLASLLVAITVVPMLAHMMFRKGLKSGKVVHHEEKPGKLANGYRRLLASALRHKIITVIIAFVLLIASFGLVPVIGFSFLPDQEEKNMMITYSPAPGDTLEEVKQHALAAEDFLLKQPDVTTMQYSIGGSGNPLAQGNSKGGLFYVRFDENTKDFDDKKDEIVAGLHQLVDTGEWKEMDMSGGLGGSNFSLSVYGDKLEDIEPVVMKIADLMKANGSFEKIDTGLAKTYDQYTLVADQQKLSQYGLTAGQIAMALMPQHDRPVLTTVEEESKTYNVYVEVDNTTYGSIKDIQNQTLQSPLGIEVPIGDVATVEEGTAQSSIARENGRMVVTVSAEATTKDVGAASTALQKEIDKIEKPATVEVKFGGVTEQMNETFSQLGLAIAAAIAIVYLVLVLTFGGALAPFAIMFALPFAIIGGLVALWIAGETLSVSALMGALMLIGIVVTNAIVLIDRVIHKEKEGLPTREAILEAAGTRLRPILMTALATIGALLPLALGFEDAGIISRGLGVTVIGGLVSSTLLTLIIVPIAYEVLMKLRRKNKEA